MIFNNHNVYCVILFTVLVITVTIEARVVPKIQIYEIRDKGNNGIELKDLSSVPNSQQKVESQLLRLLRPKKQIKKENGVTQQLIENLKALRGDEGNRITDDAFIYILQDIFSGNNADRSSSEEVFIDKTRNDRSEQQIRNILETLLRQKKPKIKKLNRTVVRSEDRKVSEEVTTTKPRSSESS